jgi:hypothetical protein
VKEVERMAEGSEYTIHRCANINDMAHTVSINGNPSHRYNIIVKLTETLQFDVFLMDIQIFGTHNENFDSKNLDLSAKLS